MSCSDSHYRAPWSLRLPFLPNGYLQSILPTLFHRRDSSHFQRQRIDIDDGDFLDLDWSLNAASEQAPSVNKKKPLVVISHGLEGHSRRPYVASVADQVNQAGMDALCWNFRSCGEDADGEKQMNRLLRFYHSGASDDLHRVVQFAISQGYQQIHLAGFSMGGNLSLIYCGRDQPLPGQVKSVTAFSVPCDLADSAAQLAQPANRIFMWRFLKDLKQKILAKEVQFPGQISSANYDQLKTFEDFDDRYTGPLHGFKDAMDYWGQSSCKPYLTKIKIPALLVNAADDPFLGPKCFPAEVPAQNSSFHFEMPAHGGHVGFMSSWFGQHNWMGDRVVSFIQQLNDNTCADSHTSGEKSYA